ncbi:hypothetical protein CC86DRAFT_34321 [Ophiobolus disseminans]|uniref:Heterokaryon incompatibility domain-containing protein n=1 Tax=Ophiobolus disseminans TaxID=1469910 RepID=A0A6A6ZYX1_9PLEO|nr:hypothetical protein CC86DRAFT_34321 [Ophiobolus disseminans]
METLVSACCWPAYEDDDDIEAAERSPLIRASTFPIYTYKNIASDEFRVLVLHPAPNFTDEIEIHLQTLNRSNDKFYEAVSYTWGTDVKTHRMLVHDEDFANSHLHGQNLLTRMLRYYQIRDQANAALDVRSNVATMLRYLRYKWLPRYLWIDAICIDQNNMDEKSQQVNQMGDIYRKSGRTLIWLGSSKTYPRPLSALEAATRSARTDSWRDSVDRIGDTKNLGEEPNEIQDEDERIHWPQQADFREILNLPWFQRRWVIQEVALSPRPRVVFGHDVMSFEDMTYFIDKLRIPRAKVLNTPTVTDSLHMLESMTSLQRRNSFHGNSFMTKVKHDIFHQYYQHHPRNSGPADFIQLLVSMSSAQCSDDRDRIYALNSLGGRPTVVDYHDSTEVVFTRFAIEEYTHSLETLYCCGAFPSDTLPSFVPDWRSSRQSLPILSFEGRSPSHLLLSESARNPNLPCNRPVFIGAKVMVAHAIPFTLVTMKGSQLPESWHAQPWRTLGKFLLFFAQQEDMSTVLTDAHVLDRMMKTLTAGVIQSGTNLEGWLQSEKPARRFWKNCDKDPDVHCDCIDRSFCEYPWMHINVHHILQRITRLMQGRCTFLTQRGDWGIGPASMLLSDQIVALPGCRYPLILRPSTPRVPRTYTVVGDCYITPFEGFDHLSTTHAVRPISIL